MSLGSDILTMIRREIREVSTTKTWSDAQLYVYMNEVLQRMAEAAAKIPNSGFFTHSEDVTINATTETKNLAAASGGVTYPITSIKSVWHKLSSGEYVPMPRIPAGGENAWRRTSDVDADFTPGWFLRQLAASGTDRVFNLHVLPEAAGARTVRVDYEFAPATVSSGTTLPWHSKWDRLVTLESAKKAFAAQGVAEKKWDEEIAALYVAFVNDCASQAGSEQSKGVEEVVGDYLFG